MLSAKTVGGASERRHGRRRRKKRRGKRESSKKKKKVRHPNRPVVGYVIEVRNDRVGSEKERSRGGYGYILSNLSTFVGGAKGIGET